MQMFALFRAKNFSFFEIYGVFTQTKGVEPVETFWRQGEKGQFLAICADIFYGQPLSLFITLRQFWNTLDDWKEILSKIVI